MSAELPTILAIIGSYVGTRGRPHFLALLPERIATQVEEMLGLADPVSTYLSDPIVARVVAELGGQARGAVETDTKKDFLASSLLAVMFVGGQPCHVVGLLGELPRKLSGQLLHFLTDDSMSDLTQRLNDQEVELVETLRADLPSAEVWTVERTCEILRGFSDARILRRALSSLADISEEMLAQLQAQLFAFDDIERMTETEIQILVMHLDNDTIALALRMTSQSVYSIMLENSGEGRRQIIEAEIERNQSKTKEEIEQAQKAVLDQARGLYEKRRISIYMGSVDHEAVMLSSGPVPHVVPSGPVNCQKRDTQRIRAILGAAVIVTGLVIVAFHVAGLKSHHGDDGMGRRGDILAGRGNSRAGQSGVRATRGSADLELLEGIAGPGRMGISRLGNGQKLAVPGSVHVLLQFPELSTVVEAEGGSQVWREDDEVSAVGESSDSDLSVIVGSVHTSVLDDEFSINTPGVRVTGAVGAVFDTRVMLDNSTLVEVEEGVVEIRSLVVDGRNYELNKGDTGRFSSSGRSQIKRLQ